MKSWYLIHTKPRQEQLAREHLERQGYQIYLPFAPVRRKRRGRTIRVVDPMFPRYLFINLSDETDDWRPIRSTIGVSALVRFGQTPARIPDSLIENLKSREDTEGIQQVPEKNFSKGDEVHIAEGLFEGFEGIYECKSGRDRVILLLKISEQYVTLKLDSNQIEPR